MDCIFCKIINNEIPSYKIYEDDLVLAFLDINPNSSGDTLVIPKKHFKDIDDIPNDTLIHIVEITRKLKEKYTDILKCDGFKLLQNNGDAQEVKHFHLHVTPYYNNNKNEDLKVIYEKLKDIAK